MKRTESKDFRKVTRREKEREIIESLLTKYKDRPCTEDLKKELYEELSSAKERGDFISPFQIILRKKSREEGHDYFEILVETKI